MHLDFLFDLHFWGVEVGQEVGCSQYDVPQGLHQNLDETGHGVHLHVLAHFCLEGEEWRMIAG